MCLFRAANFRDLTVGSARLPTLFRLSPLECMNQYRVFHPRKCLSLLAITQHKFFYHFIQQCDSLDFVQRYRAHSLITNVVFDFNHVLTPMKCDVPCICNVMHHCMSMSCHICDECHMDNLILTFYHISWKIILHAYNL